MKKTFLISALILITPGCVTHTTLTNTRIELGYEKDKGAFIGVKLFDSDLITEKASSFLDWITGK